MNIAILTFSKSRNYGANLQCYALTKFLSLKGYCVEQIDIQRPRPKMSFLGKLLRFHDNIIFPWFRKKYLNVFTKKYKTVEQLENNPPNSDAFIVGSDQVWNPNLTGSLDPLIYFLSFVPSGRKKIAYAASFGFDEWTDETLKPKVKNLLQSFHSIGVRELEGKEICKKTFDVKSEIVLDPTFLLDSYDDVCGIYESKKLSDELIYFTFKKDKKISDAVLSISYKLRSKPVLLCGIRPLKGFSLRRFVSVPNWLRSIRYAKYVVTDSFHCTVFCILFHKQFITTPAVENRNGRLRNLLDIFGLQERFCGSSTEILHHGIHLMNTPIDYNVVDSKKRIMQELSRSFLINALLK